ncbi:phage portal protein [Clostridiaceae bacterium M8S5]|nr:phage portal protein [Clostridiaceae bacterium M8S5]
MSLNAFFAENVEQPKTIKRVISSRFKDDKGNPIEWEFVPVGEKRSKQLRKEATKEVRVKKNLYKDQTDYEQYLLKLAVETIKYPNLHDKALQDSYGVMGGESLLQEMLITGEYTQLVQIINEVNKFDSEAELVEEAKN